MIKRGPASRKHSTTTPSSPVAPSQPEQPSKDTQEHVEAEPTSLAPPTLPNDEVARTLTGECRLASSIVQQWLARMSSSSPASSASAQAPTPPVKKTSSTPLAPVEPEVRPARLGLGAQYLPHHRAVKLEDNVARRLQRHIESKDGRGRRPEGGFEDEEKAQPIFDKKKKKQHQVPEEAKKTDLRQNTARRSARPLDSLLGKKTLPKKKQRTT